MHCGKACRLLTCRASETKGVRVSDASKARDEEITIDSVRGERARDGWSDADNRRNPIPPSEQQRPVDQDPASGRARDPELDEPVP
jgi:hypothetical protein